MHLQFQQALALHGAGQLRAAQAACEAIVSVVPRHSDALHLMGVIAYQTGAHKKAVDLIDQAIGILPNAGFYANRGLALVELGEFEAAVVSYDKALALQPDTAQMLFNRGLALKRLGRFDEALADYTRLLALQPDHMDAKKSIFWLHFTGLQDASLSKRLGAEIMDDTVRRRVDRLAAQKTIPDFCIAHDFEQTAYLIAEGVETDGLGAAHLRLQDIHARHAPYVDANGTIQPVAVSDAEIADLARWYRQPLRYQPQVPEHCLNPANDWAEIEERYFASVPEIIVIDDMLSPQALYELRRFHLISNVWHSAYGNHYLGAFATKGAVSPLHFRVAQELRAKMPRIFGPHRLEQLWAFKYSQRMARGINVHADFARVNLNFWVTPDDANLDPTTGGLVVYDVPAPVSWSFDEYNVQEDVIRDFLKQNNAGARRVPYKCNRAVLFNSNLFHETDELHFKPGYENRRVNVTYLFGRGLKTT